VCDALKGSISTVARWNILTVEPLDLPGCGVRKSIRRQTAGCGSRNPVCVVTGIRVIHVCGLLLCRRHVSPRSRPLAGLIPPKDVPGLSVDHLLRSHHEIGAHSVNLWIVFIRDVPQLIRFSILFV
jgi:hypothetical protein